MMFASGLGIYPSWQYSGDPAVNPKINPHVVYPDGVYQTTTQPIGPYWDGPTNGLGGASNWKPSLLGTKTWARPPTLLGLRGFSDVASTVSSIGTLIILGFAAYGGWTAFKKFRH